MIGVWDGAAGADGRADSVCSRLVLCRAARPIALNRAQPVNSGISATGGSSVPIAGVTPDPLSRRRLVCRLRGEHSDVTTAQLVGTPRTRCNNTARRAHALPEPCTLTPRAVHTHSRSRAHYLPQSRTPEHSHSPSQAIAHSLPEPCTFTPGAEHTLTDHSHLPQLTPPHQTCIRSQRRALDDALWSYPAHSLRHTCNQ